MIHCVRALGVLDCLWHIWQSGAWGFLVLRLSNGFDVLFPVLWKHRNNNSWYSMRSNLKGHRAEGVIPHGITSSFHSHSRHGRSLTMVTRLLLIILCLGVLSTVTGWYVEFPSYGPSSSGGGTDDETRQYGKQ